MKKSIAFITAILIAIILQAQPPEKMNYQSIIRTNNGGLVTNSNIGICFSILQGSLSGAVVYKETHSAKTDSNGLLNIQIGGGTVNEGSISGIHWESGPYFLKTDIDPTGGGNYSISGTSQLLSVPYSLHSESSKYAETATNAVASETAKIAITANSLSEPFVELDGDPENEIQILSISNDTIYLTGGGFVKLPESENPEFLLKDGEALELKDSDGNIRLKFDPENGEISMLDNEGVVWYSMNVNSPVNTTLKNADGSWKQTTGGNSSEHNTDGSVRTTESTKTEGFPPGDVTTTTTRETFYDNQLKEKTTDVNKEDLNGSVKTRTTERYDESGNKISEEIVVRRQSGAMGIDDETITNRTFAPNEKLIGETTQRKDFLFSTTTNSYSKGLTPLYSQVGPDGFTYTQSGETKFHIGLGNQGASYDLAAQGGSNPAGVSFFPFGTVSLYGVSGNLNFESVNVSGNFSTRGSKNFMITHPTDTSKFLLHAAIESNQPLNKYVGIITTDSNGEATVELPEYFKEINTDFSYQLTVIGSLCNAAIWKEIKDNSFVIRTGEPNVKVSWEVTAKRNDEYMKEHPFADVKNK